MYPRGSLRSHIRQSAEPIPLLPAPSTERSLSARPSGPLAGSFSRRLTVDFFKIQRSAGRERETERNQGSGVTPSTGGQRPTDGPAESRLLARRKFVLPSVRSQLGRSILCRRIVFCARFRRRRRRRRAVVGVESERGSPGRLMTSAWRLSRLLHSTRDRDQGEDSVRQS